MSNSSEATLRRRSNRGRRRSAAIGLAALAAFDLLFWWFAVRPIDEREQARREMLQGLSEQVKANTLVVDRLREAAGRVEQAREQGGDLLEGLTFSRQNTFSRLLSEMAEAAEAAGVEIRETNFNSDEIEGAENFGMVSITANLRGAYENLVRFLNLLDRSDQFLIIERLGATPRQDTGGLQVSIRIDAFVRES